MLKFPNMFFFVIIMALCVNPICACDVWEFVELHYVWFKPLFFNCPDGPWWACWASYNIMDEICKGRNWIHRWPKRQYFFQTCYCCTNNINIMEGRSIAFPEEVTCLFWKTTMAKSLLNFKPVPIYMIDQLIHQLNRFTKPPVYKSS